MMTGRTPTLLSRTELAAATRGVTARVLALALGMTAVPVSSAAVTLLAGAAAVSVAGCGDENDPNTWVKRLDDPAQRAPAIKRLSEFFDDAMTKANKNRDAPEVKTLLDAAVPSLTKTYVSVTLDEKTRKDLMKLLADTRDPRIAPALAKAYSDYEPGSNDEDVKFASQAVIGLANEGKLKDQTVIDALWSCFAKFQASKAKSINLVTDLHDAVLAVKDPSYGPKAVEKLSAPVDPAVPSQSLDQIQFWQRTAIQVISELKFAPAAKPLVTLILTPSKADLRATANAAILRIPQATEPLLIAALKGADSDFAKLSALFEEKSYVAIVADSLSWLSRPAGRAAILEALANADSDQNRTLLAQSLMHFAPDAEIEKAFLAAYAKVPPNANITLLGGANARGALIGASSLLYDAALTDWILKEVQGAKGEAADAMQPFAFDSAIKLMQPSQTAKVDHTLGTLIKGPAREKEMFQLASAVVGKCGDKTACYIDALGQPIPSSPPTAAEGAVKAAWMAAIYGQGKADTIGALADKVSSVKNAGARQAVAEAIAALAPKGNNDVADKLEKVVAADKATGDRNLMLGDDALVKVAAQLRSRALP
jgi:hypothetical protein